MERRDKRGDETRRKERKDRRKLVEMEGVRESEKKRR